jgi:hypothetical protein
VPAGIAARRCGLTRRRSGAASPLPPTDDPPLQEHDGCGQDEHPAVAAALRVVDEMPLAVRGTGFKPRESGQVSLVLRTRGRSSKLVASLSGTFAVRFTLTPIQCQLVEAIVARGDRGSRATVRPASLSCVRRPPQA